MMDVLALSAEVQLAADEDVKILAVRAGDHVIKLLYEVPVSDTADREARQAISDLMTAMRAELNRTQRALTTSSAH